MLRDVLLNFKEIVTPLMEILHPAKEVSSLQNVMKVVDMFPEERRPDPDALMAEVEVFKSSMAISQLKIEDLASAAKLCELQKLVFPLSNKAYRLAFTVPARVAKDERTFSKLKLIKTLCRSTMCDQRLEHLLLIACEKDITDELDISQLATSWALLKKRRITISS